MYKPSEHPEDYEMAVNKAAGQIELAIVEAGYSGFKPEFALTLGSGLGDLAQNIDSFLTLPYEKIYGFPNLTVGGHAGKLIMGHLCGVPIIGLSGRKHYYEVATEPNGMLDVVFPVHVMASLGVKVYFATNAVGGLNPNYKVGDLMVINGHIDLFMPDPLVGRRLDFGDNLYFQPQNTEYDAELSGMFLTSGKTTGHTDYIHVGTYVARSGRTYETSATSQALKILGADAVGMSVIPEIIVATNRGMKTMAVSIVTNEIDVDGTNATSHEEVMAILNSQKIKKRLNVIFCLFFTGYAKFFLNK